MGVVTFGRKLTDSISELEEVLLKTRVNTTHIAIESEQYFVLP